MPKRKKKPRYKKQNGSNEALLVGLHKLVEKPGSDRELAQSLLTWYLKNKFWTEKQLVLVKGLISRNKNKKVLKPVKYHLYAIGDGESVKLGISTNIGNRLNSMQTGHPKRLKVLWKFFVGREKAPSYAAERKLHRFCKKYKLRGEWFKGDCMDIVNQFSLKEKITMANEQAAHDMKLLAKSPI
jgi:hypothetical protein